MWDKHYCGPLKKEDVFENVLVGLLTEQSTLQVSGRESHHHFPCHGTSVVNSARVFGNGKNKRKARKNSETAHLSLLKTLHLQIFPLQVGRRQLKPEQEQAV